MKQVIQSLKTGATETIDVPAPKVRSGHLLVQTHVSLVSAGTERMLKSFGEAGLIAKARQQPDKVRMVIDKISTDGLLPTIESVRQKLDQPIPMGYCNAGEVIGLGAGVTDYALGDRVVSNGHHAELVCVPANLCARIPESVPYEDAVFSVLGAVALQGIRLAKPTLGETFMVTGLGVVGLLAVQLLRAHGCKVLASDFDPSRVLLARSFGAEAMDLSSGIDPVAAAHTFTRGRGVDGVLITASTDSDAPIQEAAQMCRKRGRITLVGVTGLNLSRDDFYRKELTFQVSCSYGPGRYDPLYEEQGQDYPLPYVRWTEQRNFEAVIDMMASGGVQTGRLVTDRFVIAEAPDAYEKLDDRASLGILIDYPDRGAASGVGVSLRILPEDSSSTPSERIQIGVIGAGGFAEKTLIPALRKGPGFLKTISSANGLSAARIARKFGIAQATGDTDLIMNDPEIGLVVIATPHDSHADLVCQALRAQKHVFVEKPLAITREQLEAVEDVIASGETANATVLVGFNRRFSPQVAKMKSLLDSVDAPMQIVMTINAGSIAADHWIHNPSIGGGRIIGEACHFIDLARYLSGDPVTDVKSSFVDTPTRDTVSFLLGFSNGSSAAVHYLCNGNKGFPKERIEVFCGGRVLTLDNFRRLRGYGWPGFKKLDLWRQDKGHTGEIDQFLETIHAGSPSPIPISELIEVTRISFELAGI